MGFVVIALVVLVSYYFVALPVGYEASIRNAEASFSRKLATFQVRYNNLLSTENVIAVNQDLLMTAQEDSEAIPYIMILDDKNVVLYSSDMSVVGFSANELSFPVNVKQNNRARSSGLIYFERIAGTHRLVGYAGISYYSERGPQQNTLLVLLDATPAAEQSLTVAFSTLVIVFTALLFMGALYGILLHFKIHERVQSLLLMAREIGRSTKVGEHQITGKDELAQIAQELEHMASLLSLREGHLQSMRFQAEQVSENKSRFLSTMSHEIRTPLTGLIGFLELALGKYKEDDSDNYLEISLQSANSLLVLVNEILDLSRLENNRVTLDPVDVNLRDFVMSVIAGQAAFAKQRGLDLTCEFIGDPSTTVKMDTKLLGQVLLNLISNALKFTQKGKVLLKASVGDFVNDGYPLTLQVIDTGIGIPESQIPRLFNRYEQIDEDQGKASHFGTGLGLSIVKEISRLMQIHVDVKSQQGAGTKVTLTLNVAEGSPEQAAKAQKRTHVETSGDCYQARVMIVDDNHINRMLMTELVVRKASDVFALESGELAVDYMKAVKMGEAKPVDIILMDINMPGQNGDEAQREIRALDPRFKELPIIAVTANTIKGAREKLLAAGMTDFISKPIKHDAFDAKLDIFLAGHKVLATHEMKQSNQTEAKEKLIDAKPPQNLKDKEDLLSDLLDEL